MGYDAIIIGAGVGGLVSALKLSCLDKNVLVIEKQPIPGGFATTFTRNGFIFESSIHCVDALTKDEEIRSFLEESGINHQVSFIELTDFARIIYPQHDFVADFKHDNFISFLKKSFPEERKNIDRIFRGFKRFNKQFDRFYASGLPEWIKLCLSFFLSPSIITASQSTIKQFIENYSKDPKLQGIISDIWRFAGLPPSKLSALYFLLIFKAYYYKPTAYIKGGFLELFKAMVKRIQENGSEVKFNTSVKRIITDEGNSAIGVATENKEEFKAKVIISNANAIDTLTNFLDNEPIKEYYRKRLSLKEKSVSCFQVYLGLKLPAKNLGMNHFMFSINTTYEHDDNFNYSLFGDYERCSLALIDHAQIDPTLVPEGKGSLLITTLDAYKNWHNLEEGLYKKRKDEVAHKLIARAEKYLPGLSNNIELMEAATPKTMAKFGSSPEGAIYGFAQTVNQAGINRLSQETKVRGLILAGAWTRPGAGVHACFVSGLDAADLALKITKA